MRRRQRTRGLFGLLVQKKNDVAISRFANRTGEKRILAQVGDFLKGSPVLPFFGRSSLQTKNSSADFHLLFGEVNVSGSGIAFADQIRQLGRLTKLIIRRGILLLQVVTQLVKLKQEFGSRPLGQVGGISFGVNPVALNDSLTNLFPDIVECHFCDFGWHCSPARPLRSH